MAKKIILLILIVVVSIILASIYGVLHNQISYSISSEYFTEFKFEQFGFVEYGLNTPRLTAGLIGIWSTWWVGLLIGLINGIIGFIHPSTKLMWKGFVGATLQLLKFTFLLGVIGAAVGFFTLLKTPFDWDIPSSVIHRQRFLSVGTMHIFSYLGAAIGLIFGIRYHLRIKKPVPNSGYKSAQN